jgi:hypothetical protein
LSVTVIKGFACPLNERGHRAGQLSQICMTRCASYRSSSRKADGQMNGKGRSFDWQRPSYNGGSSPSNSLQVDHVLRFCRLTTISLLFFDPAGYGADRCDHDHVGPVYYILRCWLVMSRIGQGTGPKTPAPLRRTLAAFYARG